MYYLIENAMNIVRNLLHPCNCCTNVSC